VAVEGGVEGWRMGRDILSRKVRRVSGKDDGWFREEGEWRVRTVPLGEGLVPWRKVFEILGKTGFNGPVSVHSEYDLPLAEILKQTQKDVKYLKNILSPL